MKKIYIAGKIGYLPEHVYRANFITGKAEASELGYEPISPVDLPHDHDKTWKAYMKEDLKALRLCDAIYMLDNWSDSRGARIERWYAIRYGITVIYQPTADQLSGIAAELRTWGYFVNIDAKSIATPERNVLASPADLVRVLNQHGFLTQISIV